MVWISRSRSDSNRSRLQIDSIYKLISICDSLCLLFSLSLFFFNSFYLACKNTHPKRCLVVFTFHIYPPQSWPPSLWLCIWINRQLVVFYCMLANFGSPEYFGTPPIFVTCRRDPGIGSWRASDVGCTRRQFRLQAKL